MPRIMNRRDFFRLPRSKSQSSNAPSAPPNPLPVKSFSGGGLEPYTGLWGPEQIRHLVQRTMYGATRKDLADFGTMDLSASLTTLIQTSPTPPPPINDYDDGVDLVDPDVAPGDTWINAEWSNDFEYYRIISHKAWWLGQLLEQEQNIHQKMITFWHNHIPIQFYEVFWAKLSYQYHETIRTHALGNFKELVKAISIEPGMLLYLNGTFNSVFAPDENYARELQELFCIGKGPGSQYKEEDVQAAARVLTGWRLDWNTGDAFFYPDEHDTGDKQFSSFYNQTLIQGKTGPSGAEELDSLLDMIFDQPETALFICRKLYRYFVYGQISPWAESNIIEPLAELFRTSNYDIQPVLSALLGSAHFYDPEIQAAMIKSPLDLAIGIHREMKTVFPPPAEYRDLFQARMFLSYYLYEFLMQVGDPPNVAGWPAWYQAPSFDRYWISTSTIVARKQFFDGIIWWGLPSENYLTSVNFIDFVTEFPDPSDPNLLIENILDHFYILEVNQDIRDHLKSILLSGQQNDLYWTLAWGDYIQDPGDEMKKNIVEYRLRLLFLYIFNLEEIHLM